MTDIIASADHSGTPCVGIRPHVSTGVAPHEYLDKMGAAVYQLGAFGTAAKKLEAWDLR